MPEFSFFDYVFFKTNRRKLASNDEWAITCRTDEDSSTKEYVHEIEISRKGYKRRDSVFGAIHISRHRNHEREFAFGVTQNVSEILLPGKFGVTIPVEGIQDTGYRSHLCTYRVFGYLSMTENSDKCVNALQIEKSLRSQETQTKSLENKESKKEIHEKSLAEKLLNDFERLLDPKKSCFADVTLKCGDATIAAHKSVLSARSPVFAAMFANSMTESIKNEVEITDIDLPTINALLVYMYTAKISAFTEPPATDLLFAADKYQLHELKRVCSDFLKDTMSLQNVLRILVLGDMIDQDLKSYAVNYICNKCTEFSALENTEEWKSLQKERPALAMEILTSLVKSMNGKLKK